MVALIKVAGWAQVVVFAVDFLVDNIAHDLGLAEHIEKGAYFTDQFSYKAHILSISTITRCYLRLRYSPLFYIFTCSSPCIIVGSILYVTITAKGNRFRQKLHYFFF